MDHHRGRSETVRARRTGLRRAQEESRQPRFHARAPQRAGDHEYREQAADHRIKERRGKARRERPSAQGRVRRVFGPLGSSRRWGAGKGRLDLQRRARAFTEVKPQPKRSILFLMVTAEEQGLLGSQYYSVTPLYPLAKTAANINIDGINQWGKTKDITVIGLGASDLDDYLRQAAQEQNRTLTADPEAEKGFYYRSDHFNFAKQGVPALDPDSGVDFVGKPADWGKKKRDEYTEHDYHAPSDEVKPDWDLSGAAEDAQLLFAVGYRVANADKLPEWKPGNEFKAKRDAMRK
ncbi:MAG: hypothetical protein DMF84_29090 [Acidobacteria bacterium]|nr:MAG: hypothetical protein DMF84_29090 [Acidobacteriota bacterium]